jgi:hypothetical protein
VSRIAKVAWVAHRLLLCIGVASCVVMISAAYLEQRWLVRPAKTVVAFALLPAVLIYFWLDTVPVAMDMIRRWGSHWRKR